MSGVTPEKRREYQQRYERLHPDRVKAQKAAYRAAHRDKYAALTKKWRENNPELAKATERKYMLTEKGRNLVAIKNTRRRAILKGVPSEGYDRMEVYSSDSGICCICEEYIDLSYPPRHKLSFTIQHLKPISLGGWDVRANVKPAHYSCNSRVGNRLVMI